MYLCGWILPKDIPEGLNNPIENGSNGWTKNTLEIPYKCSDNVPRNCSEYRKLFHLSFNWEVPVYFNDIIVGKVENFYSEEYKPHLFRASNRIRLTIYPEYHSILNPYDFIFVTDFKNPKCYIKFKNEHEN